MRIHVLLSAMFTLVISAMLLGCGGQDQPQSDAEFLESVRETGTASESASSESGLIDPAAEGKPPAIVLETNEFDMGTIPTTEITFKDMKVFNQGNQPLTISNISTTCPCTEGEMVEDTIPAGGIGTMRIRLDPEIVPKYYSRKVLTITSNDPINPRVSVAVTARLEGELKFSQDQIIFPDPLDVGEGDSQSVRIIQTTPTPITIVDAMLQGAPEGMTVDVTPVPEADRADATLPEWQVTVTVAPGTPAGNYKPIARVVYNDGRKRDLDADFPVRVTVKGVYTFAPQEITLRNVNAGEVYEGVTTLTSEAPLSIDSVETVNPAVTVTHAPGEEPNSYVFSIEIPERPDNRLQKDEWTIAMTVDGKQVTETVKFVALLARQ